MKNKAADDTTFNEITETIRQYLAERGWTNNPPRGLATSITLEAAELLEHYQWGDKPVGDKDELAAELADIFIYAFQFAMYYNIDIPEAIRKKLEKAAEKYPAKNFKGKTGEEHRTAWLDAKLNYKKEGL